MPISNINAGQQYYPIIQLKFQEFLFDNFTDLKKAVSRQTIENVELLNKLVRAK